MISPSMESCNSLIGLDIDTDFIDSNNNFPRRQPCVGSWYPTYPISPQFMPVNFREEASTPIRNILNNQFDELEFLSDDILKALIEQCNRIIISREQNSKHNLKLAQFKSNNLFNSSTNIKYIIPSPVHLRDSSSFLKIENHHINDIQNLELDKNCQNKEINIEEGQEQSCTNSIHFENNEIQEKELYIGTVIELNDMKSKICLREYIDYDCSFPNGFKYFGFKNDYVRVSLRTINHSEKKITLNFINKIYEKDSIVQGIVKKKKDNNDNFIYSIIVKGVKHAYFTKNFIPELIDGDKILCKIYNIFDFKDKITNKITGVCLTLSFLNKIIE